MDTSIPHMSLHDKKKGLFDSMHPKTSFIFGVVSSFALFSFLGLLVLLNIVLGGNGGFGRFTGRTAGVSVNAKPQGDTAATTVSIRDVQADDHLKGDVNAQVTIVEYSDLECPFCKQFHGVLEQAVQKYDGDVNWVFRHFPLVSLHSKAKTEAIATECAGEQGKFWEYTDLLMARTPSNNGLDLALLDTFAEEIGLDVKKFKVCRDENRYEDVVDADTADANAAGARGTPFSVILGPNGEKVPIPGYIEFGQLSSALDQLLAEGA